ncbi:MAG TPA: GDP-mannose mannosyl hydrolase [Holophagaceae bacterium]|nr:GDP-mannose mannosyl hydrolase [Holophagaceae bacterium]
MWLEPEAFQALIAGGPLVSLDLIVSDPGGRVLVGRRRNRPAQGWWFVPGGRVGKNERLDDAFRRICKAELGCPHERRDTRFLGVYEHLYEDNALGVEGLGTHYVVLGHAWTVEALPPIPEDQHHEVCWMGVAELLAHPGVHDNTKAYFRGQP